MVVGSSTVSIFFSSTLLLLLLAVFPFGSNSEDLKACKLDSIFQFGDSLADTGNLIRENPSTPFSHLPYGQTFFNKPTGRCSNGLLMVDYFGICSFFPSPFFSISSFIYDYSWTKCPSLWFKYS